jgi:hypothetical protein
MRTAIATALKAGMKLLEGAAPATFIYRNGRYPCIPTTERRGAIVVIGGVEHEVSLSLIVRKDAVPRGITVDADDISVDWSARDVLTADAGADPPAKTPYAGRRVGTNSRLYRIIAVRDDPVGSHWTIDLADSGR